jgi:hypothetical protein
MTAYSIESVLFNLTHSYMSYCYDDGLCITHSSKGFYMFYTNNRYNTVCHCSDEDATALISSSFKESK